MPISRLHIKLMRLKNSNNEPHRQLTTLEYPL
jgi:hypothetical protein